MTDLRWCSVRNASRYWCKSCGATDNTVVKYASTPIFAGLSTAISEDDICWEAERTGDDRALGLTWSEYAFKERTRGICLFIFGPPKTGKDNSNMVSVALRVPKTQPANHWALVSLLPTKT